MHPGGEHDAVVATLFVRRGGAKGCVGQWGIWMLIVVLAINNCLAIIIVPFRLEMDLSVCAGMFFDTRCVYTDLYVFLKHDQLMISTADHVARSSC